MNLENNILWITERFPPHKGGMAVSSGRKVENLRRRDVRVDVIAFTRPELKVVVKPEYKDGGVDYHLSRSARPENSAQAAWRLVEREHSLKPYSIVVGFGAGRAGHLAVTYAAWLGLPSLVLTRGNDFDAGWFEPTRGPWVASSLSRASVIGAVASEQARRIKALFPEADVRFVPNGVDVDAFQLLTPDLEQKEEIRCDPAVNGRMLVGLFGELKYKKGTAFWLGALRDAGLMEKIALLIVGKRIDEETEQILSDPALAPPSIRRPFSARDDLPGFYAACDFIALPSLFEGMPNVLLEAMALGTPAIVSSAGAMPDLVRDGETGFVFPVQDRLAAAEALQRALALDKEEREAMGQKAKRFVTENFSIQRETEALCEIFAQYR